MILKPNIAKNRENMLQPDGNAFSKHLTNLSLPLSLCNMNAVHLRAIYILLQLQIVTVRTLFFHLDILILLILHRAKVL